MRETGSEINELAEHFGIHRATVINHLNCQGVEGRRRQGRALSDEQLEQAGEFYARGHSLIETGERFDVDRRYLRTALPAAGFELRRPGRRKAPFAPSEGGSTPAVGIPTK